jgi:hypothetical protein
MIDHDDHDDHDDRRTRSSCRRSRPVREIDHHLRRRRDVGIDARALLVLPLQLRVAHVVSRNKLKFEILAYR